MALSAQLAEIGVMLLMFGVGTVFVGQHELARGMSSHVLDHMRRGYVG